MAVTDVAKEILKLESAASSKGWDKTDEARWLDLVSRFLSLVQPQGDARKSLRIYTSHRFALLKGTNIAQASVHDVSHRGMSATVTDISLHKGDIVWVETRRRDLIRVRCQVKWVKQINSRQARIGLQFSACEGNGTAVDVEAKQAFSTAVYYPAYVWFLWGLSQEVNG